MSHELLQENQELKILVAELFVANRRLKNALQQATLVLEEQKKAKEDEKTPE